MRFLVQFDPISMKIGFVMSENHEDIDGFYERVNASDWFHKTIVLSVECNAIEEVKGTIFQCMRVLYS